MASWACWSIESICDLASSTMRTHSSIASAIEENKSACASTALLSPC
jgi:hypothetical protein